MIRSFFLLRAAALGLILLSPKVIFSQEQLGMRLERYAGIYSSTINPANTTKIGA